MQKKKHNLTNLHADGQADKATIASMKEHLDPSRRMRVITDTDSANTEVSQKLARAKETADKITEDALDIPRKRKGESKQ